MRMREAAPEVRPCALCGGKPTLHQKRWPMPPFKWHDGRFFRLTCDSPRCPGHHGCWSLFETKALHRWNASQSSKRSTIRRYDEARRLANCL